MAQLKNSEVPLRRLLGNQHQLMIKCLAFHWNMTGPNFLQLHELTQKLYEELFQDLDDVAERLLALGLDAPYTQKELLDAQSLKDTEARESSNEMLKELTSDYQKLISQMYEDIKEMESSGDLASADLLTGYIRSYEKNVWLLKSHIQ